MKYHMHGQPDKHNGSFFSLNKRYTNCNAIAATTNTPKNGTIHVRRTRAIIMIWLNIVSVSWCLCFCVCVCICWVFHVTRKVLGIWVKFKVEKLTENFTDTPKTNENFKKITEKTQRKQRAREKTKQQDHNSQRTQWKHKLWMLLSMLHTEHWAPSNEHWAKQKSKRNCDVIMRRHRTPLTLMSSCRSARHDQPYGFFSLLWCAAVAAVIAVRKLSWSMVWCECECDKCAHEREGR